MAGEFRPPLGVRGAHKQTILPTLLRAVPAVGKKSPNYTRERLELPDGDFCDLDWLLNSDSKDLIIIAHGLEGSSDSHYVSSAAELFHESGFNVLAWNNRGCSGEVNRLLEFYHSGKTDDLRLILARAEADKRFERIVLLGFSVGGNIILKLLGESGYESEKLNLALAVSVPVSLEGCSLELAKSSNWVYMRRFLVFLKDKLERKKKLFPNGIDLNGFEELKNFEDYDGRYTAQWYGYSSAQHYWDENSSLHFLPGIKTSSVLLSSYDDPFLSPECFPKSPSKSLRCIYTDWGGHVGFMDFPLRRFFWLERKLLALVREELR